MDLIVTSPPYFALRSYTDGGEHYDGQIGSEPTPQAFLEALWAVTAECKRVLKPSGSMWVNLGDKYSGAQAQNVGGANRAGDSARTWRQTNPANTGIPNKSLMGLPWRYAIGCIDNLGLILRAEVVWSKPNGLPESVTDRVRRSHEQWFHLTREPRYFAAVDEVREPHNPKYLEWAEKYGGKYAVTTGGDAGTRQGSIAAEGMTHRPDPLGKLPGSVWTIPSEPLRVPDWLGVDHFAAFPQEWPRRIILGWSPSGICVECGEGRRPIVVKEPMIVKPSARRIVAQESGNAQRTSTSGTMVQAPSATITGYACACDTPDAPTRPAVILDPFGGTGTVAMVARALGRYGISFDLSSDYLRLARWRVWKSGHEYKTHAREWAEANDAIVDGKVKVPAKVKRQIEAEMLERQIAGRRLERDAWSAVCRG